MKYYKAAQFVPDKGHAWMFYECEDDLRVKRLLTYIPETKEIQRNEKPVIKRLFRPELLQEIDAAEFNEIWEAGGE